MKLNHANLCARNVLALTDVLERHFYFERLQGGEVPATGASYAILKGRDGFSLVITQIDDAGPRAYPKDFHIGFTVDTQESVRRKHEELLNDGQSPTPVHSYKAMGLDWTSFMLPVGDGMAIEVNAHS